MSLFNWLLIGHLVGDWFLQNDWMVKGKKEGLFTIAGMSHFAIYTSTVMAILWFSGAAAGQLPLFYLMGIVLFMSHWLIDATHVVTWWIRFYGQSNLMMMRIMVDQVFHVLVLALLATLFSAL